jgi:hypothetical protein
MWGGFKLGILHGEVLKFLILSEQMISLIWSRKRHKQALKIPHLGPPTLQEGLLLSSTLSAVPHNLTESQALPQAPPAAQAAMSRNHAQLLPNTALQTA